MKTKMSVSNNAWNSDVTFALGFYRIIARIMGIWPLDNEDLNPKMQMVFIIIVQVSFDLFIISVHVIGLCQFRLVNALISFEDF